ncbi:lipase family protein [Rhodococcus spelaei]|uniref:lipase family protein n=1 Tax=Rhodococcus spelaei TaxID=2546320 RepID=UPI003F4991B8
MLHRVRRWIVAAVPLGLAFAVVVAPVPAVAQEADTGPGVVVSRGALAPIAELPDTADSYRLVYWTEGPTGTPARSAGAVYLPEGTPPPGGWPVMSWAHGTTGVGDDCAPSSGYDVTPLTRDYISAWLAQGYAVVATDYVGLGTEGEHAYLHGRSEGRAVIDMVRAARAVTPSLSKSWVAFGHSQGGHAVMFAAHEATSYAPELDYRGAVATGTPANLEQLFPFGGPGFPNLGLNGLTAFAAYVIDGLKVARPDLPIDDYLTPAGRELVKASETMCFVPLLKHAGTLGVGEMLSRPLDNEQVRSALRDYLAVPTTGYDRPVFVGHGLTDQTVPFPLGAKLALDLQVAGQPVTFRPYPGNHGDSVFQALPDTSTFVRSLFGR